MQLSSLRSTASILFTVLTVSASYTASAQDTQSQYQRKSISYVDAVVRLGSSVQLRPEQEKYLLETIKREIEMARFDYNPLPERLLTQFRRALGERRGRDMESLGDVLNDILVPEIMRILDYEKEMRARELVSEAERHSFVVEKAKEVGITAEDLEAIMNSAYIYVPVLSHAAVQQDEENNKATSTLRGGIIWFAIKTDETGSSVDLLVKEEATGTAFAKLDGQFSHEGRTLNGAQYAFAVAAKTLASNLRVATQKIPEFQLTNPLGNTGAGWVEFSMGKKEGLSVDDKFIITEFYEESDGSLTQKKLGMVRVSKVANNLNKRADSRARTVIGGGYERGMLALEHPRLPIDLSFRFALLPVSVDSGGFGSDLALGDDITSNFYVGQLWFNYNLARSTSLSQFFFSFYGEVGTGTLEDGTAFGEDLPGGLYWGVGAGLVKKFYVNRLHIGFEGLASYASYTFSDTYNPGTGNYDWKWMMSGLGLTLNGNLEIALGYDLNFGGGVSYRLFAPSDEWTYTFDEDEIDLSDVNGLPEFDFSGLGFQVYFTWSLPSLSYDPLAAARGAVGY
jgi:hypothetical protein